MTDWTALLLPASFNGLAFHVESAHVEAGHRVAKTLIPNGSHVLESFGPAARSFEVDAYVTGIAGPARAAALLAAAESLHRGVMVLPDSGARRVRLTKAKRAFEKDKLGYLAVTLEAVAEPSFGFGGLSANALESAIYAASGLAATALGVFAAAGFALRGQPAPVVEAAIISAAGPLGDLQGLRSAARLSPDALAASAPAFDAASAALASFADDPASYGAALGQAAIALGDAADPAALLEAVISSGRPTDPPAPSVTAPSAATRFDNALQGAALTAAARAIAIAEGFARRSFADRGEAIAARALAAAVFDDALARAGRAGLDLARELSAMKGLVAELATRRAADVAPLITVSAPLRLPALWWAWRLYADPSRAEGLAARARAPHLAVMPREFEALAS